jgi:LPXTG-motif cell wall-anchored protein
VSANQLPVTGASVLPTALVAGLLLGGGLLLRRRTDPWNRVS